MSNLDAEYTKASQTLTTAMVAFDGVTKGIEKRYQELVKKEEDIKKEEARLNKLRKDVEEKERKWKEEEPKMRALVKELEDKKKEWEGIEKKMEENARKLQDRIQLDVGGKKYSTTKATLLQAKGSLFESMLVSNHPQHNSNGEFFIDHNPEFFGLILDHLRDGRFRNADVKNVDWEDLTHDFVFFKLPLPGILLQRQFEGGSLISLEQKKQLAEWLPSKTFTLVYKASRDGFKGPDFHKHCDNKGPTITIFQSKEGGHLFGGFTSQSWEGADVWKSDPTAFIFTLTNPHSIPPTKYNPKSINGTINCDSSYGPIFGKFDMQFSARKTSFGFPKTYNDTTGKGSLTFTGGNEAEITEIEVYSVQ